MASASKSRTGNAGRPEFTAQVGEFFIVGEDKKTVDLQAKYLETEQMYATQKNQEYTRSYYRSKVYKVASFFTGLGGMDLGGEGDFVFLGQHYKKNPLKTVYAMDFDKPICDIYNANFGIECQHKDINLVSADEIPDHDILTGGFPCQSFSVIAQNPKRLGYDDDKKGKLFFEMCRILKEKKPAVFVAENVKGLLSANKGEAFPLVIQEFETQAITLNTKSLTPLTMAYRKNVNVFLSLVLETSKHMMHLSFQNHNS